ncbi:MAG: hypothetical protein MI919_10390, partial [Holophagales bacterium]|nr:hypothetical protein [Holophagales bacterium]
MLGLSSALWAETAAEEPEPPATDDRPTVEAEIVVTSTVPELMAEDTVPGRELESDATLDLVEHLR